MTPEEMLKSLKSNDEWTVNTLAPRLNPFADAVPIRTPSRARVIVLEFAAVAAVIALVVGVIGAQNVWRSQLAEPDPLPAPLTTQTPVPTPPAPEATVTPPEVSNTPEPPPAATTKPRLEDLELSTAGLGELKLGAPVAIQDGPTALVRYDELACPGPEITGPGWVSRYSSASFQVFVNGGNSSADIVSVSVASTRIYTTKGIHIGSTKDELFDAYDEVTEIVTESTNEKYYSVTGDAGMLVFAVLIPGQQAYEPGTLPDTVTFMEVTLPDYTDEGYYNRKGLCAD